METSWKIFYGGFIALYVLGANTNKIFKIYVQKFPFQASYIKKDMALFL